MAGPRGEGATYNSPVTIDCGRLWTPAGIGGLNGANSYSGNGPVQCGHCPYRTGQASNGQRARTGLACTPTQGRQHMSKKLDKRAVRDLLNLGWSEEAIVALFIGTRARQIRRLIERQG